MRTRGSKNKPTQPIVIEKAADLERVTIWKAKEDALAIAHTIVTAAWETPGLDFSIRLYACKLIQDWDPCDFEKLTDTNKVRKFTLA